MRCRTSLQSGLCASPESRGRTASFKLGRPRRLDFGVGRRPEAFVRPRSQLGPFHPGQIQGFGEEAFRGAGHQSVSLPGSPSFLQKFQKPQRSGHRWAQAQASFPGPVPALRSCTRGRPCRKASPSGALRAALAARPRWPRVLAPGQGTVPNERSQRSASRRTQQTARTGVLEHPAGPSRAQESAYARPPAVYPA